MTITKDSTRIDREIALGDNVIGYYNQLCGEEEAQTTLADLLASLLHWARGYDLDFNLALGRADRHFDEELAEAELAQLMGDQPYTFTVGEARKAVEELKLQRKQDKAAAPATGPDVIDGEVLSVHDGGDGCAIYDPGDRVFTRRAGMSDIDAAFMATLRDRIQSYLTQRRILNLREDRRDYPTGSEWQGSDDTAVEIVRDLAQVLGIESDRIFNYHRTTAGKRCEWSGRAVLSTYRYGQHCPAGCPESRFEEE